MDYITGLESIESQTNMITVIYIWLRFSPTAAFYYNFPGNQLAIISWLYMGRHLKRNPAVWTHNILHKVHSFFNPSLSQKAIHNPNSDPKLCLLSIPCFSITLALTVTTDFHTTLQSPAIFAKIFFDIAIQK